MGKKIDKTFLLTDESVNRYGFRVLTGGGDISSFLKNPIMLWGHFRDEGSKVWCDYKPIGHWEDIEVNDNNELTAKPYFDMTDELSIQICKKVEEGTIRACSIGFRVIETSEDPELLVKGQTRATVTKWELMEVSLCDIPANANAVRLFDGSKNVTLSLSSPDTDIIPLINNKKSNPMKLKATMLALLAFLGIAKDKVDETELTEDQLSQIDAEMSKLRKDVEDKTSELASEKTAHETALTEKETEITSLKTEKSNLENEVKTLKSEKAALEEQVRNLKGAPAPSVKINPDQELDSEKTSSLEALEKDLEDGKLSFSAFVEKAKELGI